MSKRNYTHVQQFLPEIQAMVEADKTQREIAEYYGFKDKSAVKKLLERERKKNFREYPNSEAGNQPRRWRNTNMKTSG